MKLSLSAEISVSPDQISCDLNGETVLLHLKSGQYFGLDAVGSVVWQRLQTPQGFGALVDSLVGEFEVDGETCRRDVQALLEQLLAQGLVQVRDVEGG